MLNMTSPKKEKKLIHYWAAVLGGAKLIGPFFYPEVQGKTVMDRVTHLQYVQPGPSMTFLVNSDPSKTVFSDPPNHFVRITINRFRRITINQERH